MFLLHFYRDGGQVPSEYIVLVNEELDEASYREDWGTDGWELDIYDLSTRSEWPSQLPTDRHLVSR